MRKRKIVIEMNETKKSEERIVSKERKEKEGQKEKSKKI